MLLTVGDFSKKWVQRGYCTTHLFFGDKEELQPGWFGLVN